MSEFLLMTLEKARLGTTLMCCPDNLTSTSKSRNRDDKFASTRSDRTSITQGMKRCHFEWRKANQRDTDFNGSSPSSLNADLDKAVMQKDLSLSPVV